MRRALLAPLLALGLGGCGVNVVSADLFLLRRTGGAGPLSMVVSDGGTVRCNGAEPRAISSSQLITARDAADAVAKDARAHLALIARPGSIYRYSVQVQDGTVRFADNATGGYTELDRLQLLALTLCGGR